MNHNAQVQLAEVIRECGAAVASDPRRLRSLLTDRCPALKKETYALAAVAQVGLAAEIHAHSSSSSWVATAPRWIRKLVDNLAMDEAAARWAVESWGLALGKIAIASPHDPLPPLELDDTDQDESPEPADGRTTRGPERPSTAPRIRPPKRPVWVYLVFLIYLAMTVTVVVGMPLVGLVAGEFGVFIFGIVFALLFAVFGGALLAIPIGRYWELPVRQRSITYALFGSATCAAALFGGAAVASHEFLFDGKPDALSNTFASIIAPGACLVWVLWFVVFSRLSASAGPLKMSDRMYRVLLAGSVAELLVAIPTHLIVRRRTECCAGMMTGLGIGVGLIVLLIALGPAVFFLFYRRYKTTYSRRAGRRRNPS